MQDTLECQYKIVSVEGLHLMLYSGSPSDIGSKTKFQLTRGNYSS